MKVNTFAGKEKDSTSGTQFKVQPVRVHENHHMVIWKIKLAQNTLPILISCAWPPLSILPYLNLHSFLLKHRPDHVIPEDHTLPSFIAFQWQHITCKLKFWRQNLLKCGPCFLSGIFSAPCTNFISPICHSRKITLHIYASLSGFSKLF